LRFQENPSLQTGQQIHAALLVAAAQATERWDEGFRTQHEARCRHKQKASAKVTATVIDNRELQLGLKYISNPAVLFCGSRKGRYVVRTRASK
jgi:hypothetical protein